MRTFILSGFLCSLLAVSACETADFPRGYSELQELLPSFMQPIEADEEIKETITVFAERECPSFETLEDVSTFYDVSNEEAPIQSGEEPGSVTITDFDGSCSVENNNMVLTLNLEFRNTPNQQQSTELPDPLAKFETDAPYFIAVLDYNDQILSRDTFEASFMALAGQQSIIHSETLQQIIALPEGTAPASLKVIAGFELTEEQYEFSAARRAAQVAPAAGLSFF